MKPIEKAERYTLSKLVVQNLKQYMIQNNMSPGEKLPAERELSQIMNVSRAILREALRSLESSGILEIRHGEGAFISANSLSPLLEQMSFAAGLSGSDGRELLEIRYMLEAAAIDEVMRQGGAFPFEELERWGAAAAQSEQAQASEADVQLHLAVVRSMRNDSLTPLAELFIRQAAERVSVRADTIAEQHDRYVRTLRSADAESAKLVLREHLGI
ncbi:FadR family transcriptional regulator [Paenibacillus mesophilus]|uniref:FadR/GntR family transcriptional regulator n=1 Tax=Paenibacillus mesophilus TaxID=2582849 RepID=UPI00110F00DF|nr:GntR family transcriptional regulator [Paenibacillus mesophilus]TMV47315.1 FadR family transcriptional regulator [Paenibacillus mesophilus]